MKKCIIGFVSKNDPFHDRMAWSGTTYKVREAIEQAGFEVIWIPYSKSWKVLFYTYILKIGCHTLFRKKKWLGGVHFRPLTKVYGNNVAQNDNNRVCDFLFFPGGAQIVPYIKTRKPVIYLSDSTVHLMFDYYSKDVNSYSKAMAMDLECQAVRNANINIRSSQWAIDSTINDCDGDKNHCHVLEFGPNLYTKDIEQNLSYEGESVEVLFIGRDWNRKGGDLAVNVIEILRCKGVDAQLSIVGPQKMPTSCVGKDFVHFYGFLNKNKPEDYQKIVSLYSKSHIFLLPTKAECSAIVFSEAAAAGLPVYTYMTGGTGNYVVDGVNGHTLPVGSSAEMFAEQIYNDIKYNQLKSLRDGALKLSKERLSWEVWSKKFKQIIDEYKHEKECFNCDIKK